MGLKSGDQGVMQLMEKFGRKGNKHAMRDRVSRETFRLSPTSFETIADLDVLEPRIKALLYGGPLSERLRTAAMTFLRGRHRQREGKDPS